MTNVLTNKNGLKLIAIGVMSCIAILFFIWLMATSYPVHVDVKQETLIEIFKNDINTKKQLLIILENDRSAKEIIIKNLENTNTINKAYISKLRKFIKDHGLEEEFLTIE